MTLVILYRYFFFKYYNIFRTAVVNNFHQEHICQQVNQKTVPCSYTVSHKVSVEGSIVCPVGGS